MSSIKEIGSEFWDVPLSDIENGLIDNSYTWFLSGRIALAAILNDIVKEHEVHKVLLPSWCCDSMIIPFINIGAKIEFYSVTFNNRKLQVNYPNKTDADIVLIMDYFGYSNNIDVPHYNCIKIRDITHSIFFRKYTDADYYFGSLRKWAGFYTGGFAYRDCGTMQSPTKKYPQYVNLRKRAMSLKRKYIDGLNSEKNFLSIFRDAETLLDSIDKLYVADKEDIVRAKYIDIESIRAIRQNNAKVLSSRLGKFAMFDINNNDCPLFFPIYVSNRDEVKNALISNQIYCPCHWGISEFHNLTQSERQIYENEISLVCDQRYDVSDMKRICEVVEKVALEC